MKNDKERRSDGELLEGLALQLFPILYDINGHCVVCNNQDHDTDCVIGDMFRRLHKCSSNEFKRELTLKRIRSSQHE